MGINGENREVASPAAIPHFFRCLSFCSMNSWASRCVNSRKNPNPTEMKMVEVSGLMKRDNMIRA